MICSVCNRTVSRSGKSWTKKSLDQHILALPDTKEGRIIRNAIEDNSIEELGLEMTDMIAGDENDGVFWAIANEFGEW